MTLSLYQHAKKTIPRPDNHSEIRYKDGDTQDIINTILFADSKLGNNMCEFAKAFTNTYDSLYELWYFTRENITYLADEPGHERVKDPRVTWKDKSGDCKSFSLFIASVLKCLHIPYRYRFASYKGNDPTHVYIVAKLKNRDIIIDATIERFDFEVSYLKKWDKMTQISYVHGTSSVAVHSRRARPSVNERIADAPKLRTPKTFINYYSDTEGELTLKLLDEQAKILSNYYGDPNGTYQKARNLIFNHSKDLHRISGHVGYVDESLYGLMAYLEYAKERSKPAGIQGSRISGTFVEDRQAIIDHCRYVKSQYQSWALSFSTKSGKYEYKPKKRDGTAWPIADLSAENRKCNNQVFFVDTFNKYLEGSAAHVLYEFIPDSQRNSLPNRASFKTENHRLANSSMARYSELDRLNIVLWERNGIMRSAAAKGLPDISPEGFINEWKKGSVNINGPRIGIAFAALLPIIAEAVAIAGSLLAAILTAKATFASEVKGYSSPGFGPEDGDFSGAPSGIDIGSILPFAAAAAGGLFLLSKK